MDALRVARLPGEAPAITEPIPRLSVVTMSALFAATMREWVVVEADDLLSICGHTFMPVAWIDLQPPGLLIEHTCCPDPDGRQL